MMICPMAGESPWHPDYSTEATISLDFHTSYRRAAWGDRVRTLVRNLGYKPHVKTLNLRKYNCCYINSACLTFKITLCSEEVGKSLGLSDVGGWPGDPERQRKVIRT